MSSALHQRAKQSDSVSSLLHGTDLVCFLHLTEQSLLKKGETAGCQDCRLPAYSEVFSISISYTSD